MKFRIHPTHLISVPIQIALLIVSFILFALFLYKPITEFHPVNRKPVIYELAKKDNADQKTVHIKVGLSITDFLKFDALKNEFEINAIIWFVFNPAQVSQETIEKFSFTKGTVTQKSNAIVTQIDAQTIKALYFIRVEFSTIPNYKRFPLDDHYLFLNLVNQEIQSEKVAFDIDPGEYTISENLYAAGWQIVEHDARAGYGKTEISEGHTLVQPKVSFSLGLSKQDYRQLLIIMLPLLLIFYCAIFAFSIKDLTLAVTLILASFSGLTAYSFVIQTVSPAVGYLMLCDYMFLLFLAATFVIFFIAILDATPEHIVSKKTLQVTKGIAVIVIYIVIVAVWYYLTNIKDIY